MRSQIEPSLLIGSVMTIVLIMIALLAPWLAPHSPFETNLLESALPPAFTNGNLEHLLGTDLLGKDMLSQLIYGARTSMSIASLSVALSLTLGVSLGIISTYFNSLGIVFERLADIWQAVPYPVLALAAVAILGRSFVSIIIILGLTTWILFYRVVRSKMLSLREDNYIQATKALGASHGRIFWHHILPNILPLVSVIATIILSNIIIFEASLSFLGVGLPAEFISWGTMAADGFGYESIYWWIPILPSLAVLYAAVAVNLLGDGLRAVLDPQIPKYFEKAKVKFL